MKRIKNIKRVVVKVGTSSLVNGGGSLSRDKMRLLVKQLIELKNKGYDVVLVTSGAIRAGMEKLGMLERPKTIAEKQGVAAIGQSLLMTLYTTLFSEHSVPVGQVLVTRDDFNNRVRYLNAVNTINTLLRLGCVPIVNENDTVAISEIKFGDNDTLSALVTASIDADLLIILSDVDGLYDSNPNDNPSCNFIDEVTRITPEIEALGGDAQGVCGTGGMKTKLAAAKIVMASGLKMVIANASAEDVIINIVNGEKVGTLFAGKKIGMNRKKRWIVFGHRIKGCIVVNDGAKKMVLENGKSLLPIGVVGCSGTFKTGDLVAIADESSKRFARGLTNYSSDEVSIIMGKHSDEMDKVLIHKDFDEVVHRDNLVLIDS